MIIWRINEADVIHQEFDREVVVINLASGSYFNLPGVAGEIWRWLTAGGASAGDLALQAVRSFDVTPARAQADMEAFLGQLQARSLIVDASLAGQSDGAPRPEAEMSPVVPRAPYESPRLQAYNELQELFLIDPVHDVDPEVGWPQVAVPHTAPRPTTPTRAVATDARVLESVRRPAAADVITAWLPELAIAVNRERGVFCVLSGPAVAAWRLLQEGPVRLHGDAVKESLVECGLVESAPEAAVDAPEITAPGTAKVDRSIEEQIRPWSPRVRPARSAAGAQARQFCERLDLWFDAVAGADAVDSRHRIAGQSVTVRTIAGQPSGALRAAIAHSASSIGADQPDLVIRAFSGNAANASPIVANLLLMLKTNWEAACGPRGEVIDLHTDRTSAIFTAGPDVLSVVDPEAGRGWLVKLDDRPYPYWEIGSPFRFLLHEYFASKGLQFVHGAAVGDETGAVLLAGPGGSGKSTTALVCAAAGLRYCGDDYCVADSRTRSIHSLYSTAKLLGHGDFARLPELRGLSANSDGFEHGGEGKGVFMVNEVWPGRVVPSMPLRAIVVPRIDVLGSTRWEPCPAGEALAALVPSTVGQLPGASQEDARRLEQLVASLPSFHLFVGSDIAGIPTAVRDLIAACG
jgi:hypothetical protein